MKVTIYEAVFTPRTVEVPTECPKCAAPLVGAEEWNVRGYCWVETGTRGRLDPDVDGGYRPESMVGSHEEDYLAALRCDECDADIIGGHHG